MAKTLQMVFQNEQAKNISINVPEIRDNVTEAEIKGLMDLIVAKNIFTSLGGNLVTLKEASIITRDVQEIIVR